MNRARSAGFTLMELLITIAVAAILLGIAVPSYRGLVQRNAVTAQINDLVGDLNYARSQAVTRGVPVYLCTSSTGTSCTTTGAWSQGWIVYAPDAGTTAATSSNILRVHAALANQITITGNTKVANSIYFDSNGFATAANNGTLTAAMASSTQQTTVTIATTGRITTTVVTGS